MKTIRRRNHKQTFGFMAKWILEGLSMICGGGVVVGTINYGFDVGTNFLMGMILFGLASKMILVDEE